MKTELPVRKELKIDDQLSVVICTGLSDSDAHQEIYRLLLIVSYKTKSGDVIEFSDIESNYRQRREWKTLEGISSYIIKKYGKPCDLTSTKK